MRDVVVGGGGLIVGGDPTPRAIELTWRGETTTFSGVDFLTQFALPNVYFHPSMACAILRQQGVRVTRAEFTGLSFG